MRQHPILLTIAVFAVLQICGGTSRAQNNRIYLSTTDSTADHIGTFPHRTGDVNDFEKLLSASEKNELASLLQKHHRATGQEIVVVTTKSFAPYNDMGSYAKDLGVVWGVGKRKQNDGLIIMLSKKQGQVQLVPNDGLKTILTDKVCNDVLDRNMMAHLEHEEYGKALIEGTRAIVRLLEK